MSGEAGQTLMWAVHDFRGGCAATSLHLPGALISSIIKAGNTIQAQRMTLVLRNAGDSKPEVYGSPIKLGMTSVGKLGMTAPHPVIPDPDRGSRWA